MAQKLQSVKFDKNNKGVVNNMNNIKNREFKMKTINTVRDFRAHHILYPALAICLADAAAGDENKIYEFAQKLHDDALKAGDEEIVAATDEVIDSVLNHVGGLFGP